ncbi:MAG: Ni,Fe-hydrogenase I large subunit, partial [Methylomonas sp.]
MLAGSLQIELLHRATKARAATIVSKRPAAATRVLLGKTPEQLLRAVPLMFSLCGNAQAYAALLACRAALDLPADPEADTARDLLVRVETLREHAWRILLDWPRLLGREPDSASVAAMLKITARFKPDLFDPNVALYGSCEPIIISTQPLSDLFCELTALLDGAIFQSNGQALLAISCETQLLGWLSGNTSTPARLLDTLYQRAWQAAGHNSVACLPEISNADWYGQFQQTDLSAFCRAPHWQGNCHESTPFSRQLSHPLIAELHNRYGNGLLARFAAVLMEVAAIMQGLPQGDASASAWGGDGFGLAQVQAARGLLLHRLELREGRVCDYRIVAPTEWNFHPDGVAVQGLRRLMANDENSLREQAQWLIHAIDPCV